MTNALWVLKFIWQKVNGLFLCSSSLPRTQPSFIESLLCQWWITYL